MQERPSRCRTLWRHMKWQVKRGTLESDFAWRYVLNLPATLAYRRNPPLLTAEGRLVLDELNRVGVAATSADRLFANKTLYDELLFAANGLARPDHARVAGSESLQPYTHEANYLGAEPLFDPESIFARF